jgi:hypothetical protein
MDDAHLFAYDDADAPSPPPYTWLDEWLCEYVDGTMDPSLEAVFEDYVRANPELHDHIERLRRTRSLLCACGAPRDGRACSERVCERVETAVECDLLRARRSLSSAARRHPGLVTMYASSVVVALVVGLWAGATLLAPDASVATAPDASAAQAPAAPALPSLRADRPPRAVRAPTPLRTTETRAPGAEPLPARALLSPLPADTEAVAPGTPDARLLHALHRVP